VQECKVRKFEKSRGVICHAVALACQEVVPGNVTVISLMVALESQKVGGRTCCGSGAFVLPVEGGSIVGITLEGPFPYIKTLRSCFMVYDAAGEFEIRVGDGTGRVFPGGQLLCHIGWESHAPDNGATGKVGCLVRGSRARVTKLGCTRDSSGSWEPYSSCSEA